MAENITKTITISEKTAKEYADNTDYIIKDQNGMTFHVYQFKKGTQQESTAYRQMVDMNLRVGSTVDAWYAEVPNKHDGISRYIASFREAGSSPVNTAKPAEKPSQGQNLKPSEDVDWDEIAVGKCQTAFLAAFLQAGNTFADAKLQVTQARKLAELVVYGQQLPQRDPIPEPEDEPPLEEPMF